MAEIELDIARENVSYTHPKLPAKQLAKLAQSPSVQHLSTLKKFEDVLGEARVQLATEMEGRPKTELTPEVWSRPDLELEFAQAQEAKQAWTAKVTREEIARSRELNEERLRKAAAAPPSVLWCMLMAEDDDSDDDAGAGDDGNGDDE